MKSKYRITDAPSAICPNKHNTVALLARMDLKKPAFYICTTCHFVGQLGVGPVKDMRRIQ